jgi:hypothetical protein
VIGDMLLGAIGIGLLLIVLLGILWCLEHLAHATGLV